MRALLKEQGAELGHLAASLHALSPLETLSRGYSITTRHEGAELIDDASALSSGDRLSIQLMRGRVEVEVLSVDPNWTIDQGLTRSPEAAPLEPKDEAR
jgi:exodeoxyribonuclease VII large subunit